MRNLLPNLQDLHGQPIFTIVNEHDERSDEAFQALHLIYSTLCWQVHFTGIINVEKRFIMNFAY